MIKIFLQKYYLSLIKIKSLDSKLQKIYELKLKGFVLLFNISEEELSHCY